MERNRQIAAEQIGVLTGQTNRSLEVLASQRSQRTGVVDVKGVGKPEMLGGKTEAVQKEWTTWSYKFTIWIGSQFEHGSDILEWSKQRDEEITSATLDRMEDQYQEIKMLNAHLHVALVNLTKEEPLDIVKNSAKYMGLDAWRRLSRAYDPNNPQSNMRLLKKILQAQPTDINNLKQAIETWEADYTLYKERTGESLSDAMQRMCLTSDAQQSSRSLGDADGQAKLLQGLQGRSAHIRRKCTSKEPRSSAHGD